MEEILHPSPPKKIIDFTKQMDSSSFQSSSSDSPSLFDDKFDKYLKNENDYRKEEEHKLQEAIRQKMF